MHENLSTIPFLKALIPGYKLLQCILLNHITAVQKTSISFHVSFKKRGQWKNYSHCSAVANICLWRVVRKLSITWLSRMTVYTHVKCRRFQTYTHAHANLKYGRNGFCPEANDQILTKLYWLLLLFSKSYAFVTFHCDCLILGYHASSRSAATRWRVLCVIH